LRRVPGSVVAAVVLLVFVVASARSAGAECSQAPLGLLLRVVVEVAEPEDKGELGARVVAIVRRAKQLGIDVIADRSVAKNLGLLLRSDYVNYYAALVVGQIRIDTTFRIELIQALDFAIAKNEEKTRNLTVLSGVIEKHGLLWALESLTVGSAVDPPIGVSYGSTSLSDETISSIFDGLVHSRTDSCDQRVNSIRNLIMREF
jgi:hypothetical protein